MTRLDPSLRLVRLIVMKDGLRAYDERFHVGVNIIRGVQRQGNSVGKSTIADMIFFALGGDLTTWKEEAALCDLTLAEVLINGTPVTLRRDITDKGRQPMSMFFGALDEAQATGADGWSVYPYQRYQDRQSFTQVLFRMLDMPEVPTEAEANITMHQLLRLMYVDQMTPVDRIFRFEVNDSALRRQAVGDLLTGAFDERIYPAQLELRAREREYETATQQFGTLNRVLTRSGEGFNLDFVEARQRETELELGRTRAQIEELRGRRFQTTRFGEDEGIRSLLQRDLAKVNADLADLRLQTSQLAYGIQDADLLIEETERTLSRLKEGEIALGALGPIAFSFCPSCLAELDDAAEGTCRLCRKDVDPQSGRTRTARMRNELSIQLRESRQLQESRREQLSSLQSRLTKLEAVRSALADEFLSISRGYLTEADAQIERLTGRVGYLERELLDIARERDLARQLAELSGRRSELNSRISELKENIASWKAQKDRREGGAHRLIAQNTADILSKDLLTEKEFASSSDVYFDFAEDRISVDGKTGFSASSLTVLRNAFHLGLHLASCQNRKFRYPRFLLLDNIEDKGMTEARSRNFQRLIVSLSGQLNVDHQIIFTTSMIDPKLDIEEYTVGDKYDFNNKSLRIGRPPGDLTSSGVLLTPSSEGTESGR